MLSRKIKWGVLPILVIAMGLMISSCNKEPLSEPTETSLEKPQDIEVDLNSLPEITKINGQKALKFGNLAHFKSILASISNMNRTALDAWEKKLGFVSMRNEFEKIEDLYEQVNSQQALDQFRNEYRSKVRFLEEGDLAMMIDMYHVGSLLNNEGVIQIGGMLQKFYNDKVISIVDGDFSKLREAETLTATDIEKQIFISPISTTTNNARSTGPDFLSCQSGFDSSNRRVKMSLDCDWWATPNLYYSWQWVQVWNGQYYEYSWQWIGVPDGTYMVTCNMELEVISQKKGFLNIVTNSNANITAMYGANIHEWNGSSTINHWMPVSASETNAKKLIRSYPVDFIGSLPATATIDYCFGPTHVAGIINSGTNCHVWN